MVKLSSAAVVLASSIALTNAVKVRFFNNCEVPVSIISVTYEGEIRPFPDGKILPAGQHETYDFGDNRWKGSFTTKEKGTAEYFFVNMSSDAHFYTAHVIDKFDVPVRISTDKTYCSPIKCLGRPGESCMEKGTGSILVQLCQSANTFYVDYCPSGTTNNLVTKSLA